MAELEAVVKGNTSTAATVNPLDIPEIIRIVLKHVASIDDILNFRLINKTWNSAALEKMQNSFNIRLDKHNILPYVNFCKSMIEDERIFLMPFTINILFDGYPEYGCVRNLPEEDYISDIIEKLMNMERGMDYLLTTFGPKSINVLDINIGGNCCMPVWEHLIKLLKKFGNHLERLNINHLNFGGDRGAPTMFATRLDPFVKAQLEFGNLQALACYPERMENICQAIIERSPKLHELIIPEYTGRLLQLCHPVLERLSVLYIRQLFDSKLFNQLRNSTDGNGPNGSRKLKELSIGEFKPKPFQYYESRRLGRFTEAFEPSLEILETLLIQATAGSAFLELDSIPALGQLKRLALNCKCSNHNLRAGLAGMHNNLPALLVNNEESLDLRPERFPNLETIELQVGTFFMEKEEENGYVEIAIQETFAFPSVKSLVLTNSFCDWDAFGDIYESLSDVNGLNLSNYQNPEDSFTLNMNLEHFKTLFPNITRLTVKLSCDRSGKSFHQTLFQINFPQLVELEFINRRYYNKNFLIAFLGDLRPRITFKNFPELRMKSFAGMVEESFMKSEVTQFSKFTLDQDGSESTKTTYFEKRIPPSRNFSGLKTLKLGYYTALEEKTRPVPEMYSAAESDRTDWDKGEDEPDLFESITRIIQFFGGLTKLEFPIDWFEGGDKKLTTKQCKEELTLLKSQLPQHLELSFTRPDPANPSVGYLAFHTPSA